MESVRRVLPTWMLVMCLGGCASSVTPRSVVVPIPRGTPIKLIAVYPFAFRWQEPSYRSFELAQHLVDHALRLDRTKVMFLGPSEFRAFRPQDDRAWASTDIVSVLPRLRIRPEEAIVLRAWAERFVASSHQEAASANGKHLRSVNVEEVTLRGHVELLHPSSDTRIGEFVAEQKVDPFAVHPEDDPDPAPELTLLMETLTAEALASVDPNLHRPFAPHALALTYRFNPEGALRFHDETRPVGGDGAPAKDSLEEEVLKLGRVRFANPGLTDAEATRLARLPGGIWVQDVEGPGRLAPGDLISAIDGQPALPESLERARYALHPVKLRVRRASGDWSEVTYP